jgi:Protein of unknown function (DUF3618)
MAEEPLNTGQRTPDQIRRDIEATRADMDQTMDQLETRVRPSAIRQRQTAKLRGRWGRARERVMGSRDYAATRTGQPYRGNGDAGSSVTDQARARGDQAAQAVKDAPDRAMAQTRGNPLAAGVIAFGVGALVGSLLPSSEAEQQAATKLRDEAQEPTKQALKEAGERSKEELQPAVQDAAQRTKERASDAAQTTKDEAQDRAQQTKDRAQEGADRARGT